MVPFVAGLPVVGVAPVPAACRFLPAAAAAAFVFLFVIRVYNLFVMKEKYINVIAGSIS